MPDKKPQSDFKVSDRRMFTTEGELRSSDESESEPSHSTKTSQPEPSRPAAQSVAATGTSASQATMAQPAEAKSPASAPAQSAAAVSAPAPAEPDAPPPPSASEQKVQHDAYRESARDLDRRVELSGHSAKELEISFERFLASLYMTAMVQLGMMHQQGEQPGVDLLGARQTIDTLGMLAEKTKGNLTSKEQAFLDNCLYELRMTYVEVTNAIARSAQAPGPNTGTNG